MQTATPPAEALDDLAVAFPGWHIRRGRDGRGAEKGWCATRQRRLTAAPLDVGLTATLSAGEPSALRGLLARQQALQGRTAGGGR